MQQFAVEELLADVLRLEKMAAMATSNARGQLDDVVRAPVTAILNTIADTCGKAGLLVSSKQANKAAELMTAPHIAHYSFQSLVISLQLVIQDECSTHIFFKIEADRKKHFEDP